MRLHVRRRNAKAFVPKERVNAFVKREVNRITRRVGKALLREQLT